jgi:uncharacterized membrane protein (UPF0127 family)
VIKHIPTGDILTHRLEHFRSARERARGLLKFSKQPQAFAAIFYLPLLGIFPAVHTMGMKFSIDLVFCDSQKRVVSIFRAVGPGRWVLPWRYFFGGCRYLIEFSDCDVSKLAVGDALQW